MHDWVEIILNKLWPVVWVKDEDILSVMKNPQGENVSSKTVKNILCVFEDISLKTIHSI